jgi:chorismate dehydratase
VPLRVSTISFLNPAPLLYNFEHEPTATALRKHYDVHYTTPATCAAELHSGAADLGLIPIASLTPSLAIVPGCTIASLDEVRSILLLVKNPARLPIPEALKQVRTLAADTASRSSVAYARILFEHFHQTHPTFIDLPADPATMLSAADAALIIGDPALLARERRTGIEARRSALDAAHPNLLWLDLAHLWRELTGLPWVAAVWAVRPESLAPTALSKDGDALTPQQLIHDLTASRDAGLNHTQQLVNEWTPRLALSSTTIRTYLRHNIHYTLDPDCLRAIELFRTLAASINALPPLPTLNLLTA